MTLKILKKMTLKSLLSTSYTFLEIVSFLTETTLFIERMYRKKFKFKGISKFRAFSNNFVIPSFFKFYRETFEKFCHTFYHTISHAQSFIIIIDLRNSYSYVIGTMCVNAIRVQWTTQCITIYAPATDTALRMHRAESAYRLVIKVELLTKLVRDTVQLCPKEREGRDSLLILLAHLSEYRRVKC